MTWDGKVDVYRNLNTKSISIRTGGRVVAHPTAVVATDVEFRVQTGGVAAVRRAGVRAVCAYARASRVLQVAYVPADLQARAVPVHFNPFRNDTFVLEDGTPVYGARAFLMTSPAGNWVIDPVLSR